MAKSNRQTFISGYEITAHLSKGRFSLSLPKEHRPLCVVHKAFGTFLYVRSLKDAPCEDCSFVLLEEGGTIGEDFKYILSFPVNVGRVDAKQSLPFI